VGGREGKRERGRGRERDRERVCHHCWYVEGVERLHLREIEGGREGGWEGGQKREGKR